MSKYKITVVITKNSQGTQMSVKPGAYFDVLKNYKPSFSHGRKYIDTGVGRFEKRMENTQHNHFEITYVSGTDHAKKKTADAKLRRK